MANPFKTGATRSPCITQHLFAAAPPIPVLIDCLIARCGLTFCSGADGTAHVPSRHGISVFAFDGTHVPWQTRRLLTLAESSVRHADGRQDYSLNVKVNLLFCPRLLGFSFLFFFLLYKLFHFKLKVVYLCILFLIYMYLTFKYIHFQLKIYTYMHIYEGQIISVVLLCCSRLLLVACNFQLLVEAIDDSGGGFFFFEGEGCHVSLSWGET